MLSIPHLAETLRNVLVTQATVIAEKLKFVKRQRQITPTQFVQTVIASFLAHPDAAYETMVGVAADQGVTITPQGLAQRFDATAVTFFQQLLSATFQQALAADPAVLPLLDRFVAVEIQDSTTIALPDTLANHFPGCGGSRGRVAAALKAQFRWELRSGRLDGPLLQEGRASDRAVAFARRAVRGSLRIHDLGYWHLDDFSQDAADGIFWLVRCKPGTALWDSAGVRQSLDTLLAAQQEETKQLEIEVQLGARHQLACRLLARRVEPDEAAKRQRRLEHTAKRKGRAVSPASRILSGWEILVTNVPLELMAAAEAWSLYRVRWQIELLFKLWKQHGKLDESRGEQPARVLVELYAKFIGLLIQHWLFLASCWGRPDRSLVKVAKIVRAWAERLFRAVSEGPRLEALLTDLVAALQRAGRQTRRKKDAATWQLLGGHPSC